MNKAHALGLTATVAALAVSTPVSAETGITVKVARLVVVQVDGTTALIAGTVTLRPAKGEPLTRNVDEKGVVSSTITCATGDQLEATPEARI